MQNFRLSIDLSDVYLELSKLDLREYNAPFLLKFIEADNPDDACYKIIFRIMQEIIKQNSSIKNRILCRMIRRFIRIDKIESL